MTGDPLDRLRQQTAKSRATYVPGTPEKYPEAELRGFTVLEAEALLREHDALVEVARAARPIGKWLESIGIDMGIVGAEERIAEAREFLAALARLDGGPE